MLLRKPLHPLHFNRTIYAFSICCSTCLQSFGREHLYISSWKALLSSFSCSSSTVWQAHLFSLPSSMLVGMENLYLEVLHIVARTSVNRPICFWAPRQASFNTPTTKKHPQQKQKKHGFSGHPKQKSRFRHSAGQILRACKTNQTKLQGQPAGASPKSRTWSRLPHTPKTPAVCSKSCCSQATNMVAPNLETDPQLFCRKISFDSGLGPPSLSARSHLHNHAENETCCPMLPCSHMLPYAARCCHSNACTHP